MQEGEPIEHPWLTKAIQGAQERVEGHNFDIRKNLLEYDDVMNQQRKTIYGMRKEVLAAGAGVPLVWFTEDAKTKKKTRHEKVVTWEDAASTSRPHRGPDHRGGGREAVPRGKNDEFDTKALQQRGPRAVQRRHELRGRAPGQGEAPARHLQAWWRRS